MDIDQKLRLWLEKIENQERLRKVAQGVIKKCVRQKLSFALMGKSIRREDIREDMVEDVASQLAVFMLENENFRTWMETFPLADAKKGGNSEDGAFNALNMGKMLVHCFIRELKDKDRSSPDGSAKRYLYKRLYSLLNEEKGLFFMSLDENRKYSFFSMAPNGPILEEQLTQDDMDQIPFPDHLVENRSFDGVNQKSVILSLAEYFWKKVAETTGAKAVRISVQDFANWIEFYVPMEEPKTLGLDHLNNQLIAAPGNPLVEDIDMLEKIIRHISALMNEKQKQAFFHHECQGMTLDETADAMGLKRASNAHYHFENAKEAMKRFIISNNLPGLKPGDLDERLFETFLDFFCRHLEKSLSDAATKDQDI